jgi:hypothetical protein
LARRRGIGRTSASTVIVRRAIVVPVIVNSVAVGIYYNDIHEIDKVDQCCEKNQNPMGKPTTSEESNQ